MGERVRIDKEQNVIKELEERRQLNQKLVKAVRDLLERSHWDLWVTITFRKERFVKSAERAFKSFLKKLNKPGEYYFDKFIKCWVFYELDVAGDRVHIHSLISGIDKSLSSELEEKCCEHFGNSEVEPYDYNHEGSAMHYLARKIGSYRLVHYDFYKINSKLRKRVKSYSKKLNRKG
jgi:hypothetical protein